MRRTRGIVEPGYESVLDTFEELLPRSMGGAALVAMHRGKVVVDLAGGTRDRDGRPFEATTVAPSFSTTKGIASTVLHVLADRGEIAYDRRVSYYWPAFGANGKHAITVRHVLSHEAGLSSVRAVVDDAAELRDFDGILTRLEKARPGHAPGAKNAYHALTYGYLVAGLVEKVTGRRFADVLASELAAPLGLSGCYVGLPPSELSRAARFVDRRIASRAKRTAPPSLAQRLRARAIGTTMRLLGADPETARDALLPSGVSGFDWSSDDTLTSCIPSAAGTFDARSLARVYAMLGNGGELDGTRVLSESTVDALGRVQNRRRDGVLVFPVRWRLGYHSIPTFVGTSARSFGHFGFGGSGGFCDPVNGIALGYVLNYGVGTPLGDSRILRLSHAVMTSRRRAA